MNRLLRNASIRTKVLALVMAVTAVALVVASGALLVWDSYQFRTDLGRELSSQARMVLENSTAAMSFQDRLAARETLDTLAPNTHIQMACLYDAAGALFARSSPSGAAAACPERPPQANLWFSSGLAHVMVRTEVAGRPAGSVYLESDLTAASDRARVQGWTTAVVLGVALVVALLLSSVLQRIISEPLYALANTARDVTTRSDYSLRARRDTGDELGVLVDAFNGMLNHIERAERERVESLAREREANRLKDEFLMMLSHELRTPLNAIQGWTKMLLLHAVPVDGVDKALQKIERNARAQAKLIEDLVDISRLTTGKFRLECADVDLVSIAQHAIEAIGPDADARHITIVPQLEVSSAPVFGDPNRLQQVMANLLSNAVKFSPPESSVSLSIRADAGTCEIRVRDEGIGIDPAFLPLVFEPFRQADSSTTRAHGGLGLGLSIVKRIIDLHAGTITLNSAGLGTGAICTINLPLASATIGRQPSPSPANSTMRSRSDLTGVRVLVVDDDPDTREILKLSLTAAGAVVERGSSVAEGLRLAQTFMPDVLISDIAMPEQDGYAFITSLKRAPSSWSPRVTIALTAQATTTDRDRALAAGFDRHVAKPFDSTALIDLIAELRRAKGPRQPL